VLDKAFTGFWMAKAYKIPANPAGNESPTHHAEKTVSINRMVVRSFIVRPEPNEPVAAGRPYPMEGIAFDGGSGIKQVQFSTDGGASWSDAILGENLGRYSFRRWRAEWTPPGRGTYRLQVRATNRAGDTQPTKPVWNRGGYMQNVIEETRVEVS
jgi:sulfite dehydrogenase